MFVCSFVRSCTAEKKTKHRHQQDLSLFLSTEEVGTSSTYGTHSESRTNLVKARASELGTRSSRRSVHPRKNDGTKMRSAPIDRRSSYSTVGILLLVDCFFYMPCTVSRVAPNSWLTRIHPSIGWLVGWCVRVRVRVRSVSFRNHPNIRSRFCLLLDVSPGPSFGSSLF